MPTIPFPDRDRRDDYTEVADYPTLAGIADNLWSRRSHALSVTVIGTGGNVGAVEVIYDADVMIPRLYVARHPDGIQWAAWREAYGDDDLRYTVGLADTPSGAIHALNTNPTHTD